MWKQVELLVLLPESVCLYKARLKVLRTNGVLKKLTKVEKARCINTRSVT